MLGETERSDEEGSFSKISVYKRILILLGGATLNIAFGLAVYFILISSIGNNLSTTVEYAPEIFEINNQEFSGIVELQEGDQIRRVDGRRVRTARDIVRRVENSEGRELTLTIRRDGEQKDVAVEPIRHEARRIRNTFGNAK